MHTFLADLTNLSVRCFSDGQVSLERLVRNQLSNVTDDVGSGAISRWTVSTAVGHLRNYVASIDSSSEGSGGVEHYVVNAPAAAADRRAERDRRIQDRAQAAAGKTSEAARPAAAASDRPDDTEEDEEAFETPRTSPEAMDVSAVSDDDDEAEAPTVAPPPPPSSRGEEGVFPRELQLRAGSGPDMVVGREPWHRSVPAEWVPIITRDQGLHPAGSASQAPFSDAYLTTVPAKKRRLAANRKADGSVRDTLQRTLSDAMKVTGVRPTTTQQEVVQSALGNARLEEGLAETARTSIKRRLEQEAKSDYKPDKFPNCKEFMDRNK